MSNKNDKTEYNVLHEAPSPKVDHLFKLYNKDKYLARVVYMNDSIGYENFRLVLFKEKNGEFSIVYFRKKYGISITNRIYSSEKRLLTITYKEGKLWIIDNMGKSKKVRPLTMNFLSSAFPQYQIGMKESIQVELILNELQNKFTWIRFIREHNVLQNIAFNTIIKNKLYNLKKALQFEYKVPKPVALILHTSNDHWVKYYFKYYLKYVKNVESLKKEWTSDRGELNIFRDTLKMAKILDEKVNCSWSSKRLRQEHDNFVKVINDIIFIGADRKMKISDIYLKFSRFSKIEIIQSTKEMAYEGKKQNHCVGTYINKVENGNCGIFRVNGYTLELNAESSFSISSNSNKHSKILRVGQLRGHSNSNPPESLLNMVVEKVNNFNKEIGLNIDVEPDTKLGYSRDINGNWIEDLPF